MNDQCLNPEDLADLASDDPRRAHVEKCPRCQSLAKSLAAFLDPTDIPAGADLEEAAAKLSTVLDREIGGPGRVVRPGSRFWTPFRVRTIAAAAAVVIVAVGLSLVRPGSEAQLQEPALRGTGAPAAPFLCQLTKLENGAFRVSWPGIAGATGYRVVVFGENLEELAGFNSGPTTTYQIIPPPGAAFCRVIALRSGDELVRSEPAYFDDC